MWFLSHVKFGCWWSRAGKQFISRTLQGPGPRPALVHHLTLAVRSAFQAVEWRCIAEEGRNNLWMLLVIYLAIPVSSLMFKQHACTANFWFVHFRHYLLTSYMKEKVIELLHPFFPPLPQTHTSGLLCPFFQVLSYNLCFCLCCYH